MKKIIKVANKDYPAGIYLFNADSGNTRTMREICSKLIIKAPEWCQ